MNKVLAYGGMALAGSTASGAISFAITRQFGHETQTAMLLGAGLGGVLLGPATSARKRQIAASTCLEKRASSGSRSASPRS